MSKSPVQIFVISLPRALDRRARLAHEFEKLGYDYEIVDGVDGAAHRDDLLVQIWPGQ